VPGGFDVTSGIDWAQTNDVPCWKHLQGAGQANAHIVIKN